MELHASNRLLQVRNVNSRDIQLNFVNSKFMGLDIYFELSIVQKKECTWPCICKLYTLRIPNEINIYQCFFFTIKHMLQMRKRDVSKRRFFYVPET